MKINSIGKISKKFIDKFELTVLLMVMLLALGIASYQLMPKESLPEIVFPRITVQTVYPGASTTDVEQLVTNPLEEALQKVDGVDGVSSVSSDGFSFITVSFEDGEDMEGKKTKVNNAISTVSLPDVAVDPTATIFNTSELPLINISVTGPYTVVELTDMAQEVQEEVLKVEGVEEVKLFGGAVKEIIIETNPVLLEKYGITYDGIKSGVANLITRFPIGDITVGEETLNVRVSEEFTNLDEMRTIILRTNTNETIFLEDIASVREAIVERTELNRTYANGGEINNSVFLSVIRGKKEDVLLTSESVKIKVEELKGTALPEDVETYIIRDTANQVEDDLSSIQSNAISGLLVVILVLFLFIGFRESLIVSITIPLTLLATLGILGFLGITLNTFAVLGLIVALGLLVDNTIIVMENMDRLHKEGKTPKEAAIMGVNQVGYPVMSATLTTVAAFFPLAILPGIIGAFINTIPRTIIITLLTSLLIAITITPSVYYFVMKHEKTKVQGKVQKFMQVFLKLAFVGVLAWIAFAGENVDIMIPIVATVLFVVAIFIKEVGTIRKGKGEGKSTSKAIEVYSRFIDKVIRSKWKMAIAIVIAISLLVGSSMLLVNGNVKVAFFPQTEPDSLTVKVDVTRGSSLEKTSKILADVEAKIIATNQVRQFSTTVGGSETDYGVINLDLIDNELSGFLQQEIITEALQNISDANIVVEAVAAGGPPVGKAIVVKVLGDNLEENKELLKVYESKLKAIEGTTNVEKSINDGANQIIYNINERKAASLGLSNAYIAITLRRYIEGEILQSITYKGVEQEVRLTMEERYVKNIDDLPIQTPFGESIPLGSVVSKEESVGITSIEHLDTERIMRLSADVKDGYNAAEILNVFEKEIETIPLPVGTSIGYGGDASGIAENFDNLLRSMIIAIFLVLIILVIQFGSLKQSLAIITTVPMAIIGVLVGLYVTNNEFGFYAFMALVSLVGIAVNDAIVLIDYTNTLRNEGYKVLDAITEATKTRFNPVFATTLTTIGGILPLSFKNTYYAQFGYALIFGLFATTLMTLVMIPIFYSLLEGKKQRMEEKHMKNDKDNGKSKNRKTQKKWKRYRKGLGFTAFILIITVIILPSILAKDEEPISEEKKVVNMVSMVEDDRKEEIIKEEIIKEEITKEEITKEEVTKEKPNWLIEEVYLLEGDEVAALEDRYYQKVERKTFLAIGTITEETYVKTKLPSTKLGAIAKGNKVKMYIDGNINRVLEGRISTYEEKPARGSTLYEVQIEMEEGRKYYVGDYVEIEFTFDE